MKRGESADAAEGPLILCADDEEANRVLIREILDQQEYRVVEARDGREALDAIRGRHVDLAVLDVMMPEMDGFEVCRTIKEDAKYRQIPVILVTALRSTEDRIKGIEAGAEEFISKPFNADEVTARVKMLLRMKALNEQLVHAYSTITEIISFGDEVLSTFNSLNFNIDETLLRVAREMIRRVNGDADKPQALIVCSPGAGLEWDCRRYEYLDGNMRRFPVGMNKLHLIAAPGGKAPQTGFLNASGREAAGARSLPGILQAAAPGVRNLAYYISPEIRVYALNYGGEISVYETSVLKGFVNQVLFLKSLAAETREVEDAFAYAMRALARASEVSDEDTGNHIVRVGELCAIVSERSGMPGDFTKKIRLHAEMHDVGKIHVSAEILNKPGKLDEREWEIMKNHTVYGARILGEHVRLAMASRIALSHHEHMDGSGYPSGLSGEAIPMEGRIVHLVDQYDALRSKRPYKQALGHETSFDIIIKGDGYSLPEHFDPGVLSVFKQHHKQLEEAYESLTGR